MNLAWDKFSSNLVNLVKVGYTWNRHFGVQVSLEFGCTYQCLKLDETLERTSFPVILLIMLKLATLEIDILKLNLSWNLAILTQA